MPDYQEMYLTLMRAAETAVRALTEAQRACEAMYVEAPGEIIRLPGVPEGSNEQG